MAHCTRTNHPYAENVNTQTHIIMGAALFGGRLPRRAGLCALAGLLPDLPMLLTVMGLKIAGVPNKTIFGQLYWQDWWQVMNAISHNFWLWGGLLVLALAQRERLSINASTINAWSTAACFAASGLLHTLIDFLCHREDAHMSLWPVTRWKFISPISYWDPQHYGAQFGMLEATLGLALAMVLFRRFHSGWVRAGLLLAMTLYLAVPAYFILT